MLLQLITEVTDDLSDMYEADRTQYEYSADLTVCLIGYDYISQSPTAV